MATAKITTLTCSIEPALMEAPRTAADREHRSIANMIERLIRGDCRENGITIQEPQTQSLDDQRKP